MLHADLCMYTMNTGYRNNIVTEGKASSSKASQTPFLKLLADPTILVVFWTLDIQPEVSFYIKACMAQVLRATPDRTHLANKTLY